MQRILKISKFRNIGIEKEECLILNHSLKKGEMGDLIILIGPNNSGKSNVLNALLKINTQNISNDDLTSLSYDENDKNPKISLKLSDNDFFVSYNLDKSGLSLSSNIIIKNSSLEKITKDVTEILTVYKDKIGNYKQIIEKILKDKNLEIEEKINSISIQLTNFYKNIYSNRYYHYYYNNDEKIKEGNIFSCCFKNEKENEKLINEYFEGKYSINPFPKIVPYVEKNISQSSLVVSPEYINENNFFKSIFNLLKIETKNISNAYESFYNSKNYAFLNKEARKINKKMEDLNTNFNKLYFAGDEKYKFEITLQKEEIAFTMTRGEEEPIILDHQSTGFKWFFNFYFNFLNAQYLNPGDIVIMDEPGTNLHPKGLEELRKFIKDFAIKNDITIIIATHSPFLISTDHFEELRVISMLNNRAHIENLFTAANINDPDSLLPIKDALTIKQNILYDLDTEVVWVEGITDYNYLTLFKKLLKKEGVSFLPFQGVGKGENLHKKILEKLLGIKFHKRNILVDGDKPGVEFKNCAKDTSFSNIICISDLNSKEKTFKRIEDLFSNEDKKKFPSLQENTKEYKKASYTSIMKKICKKKDFTEETIKNFEKLFNLLIE